MKDRLLEGFSAAALLFASALLISQETHSRLLFNNSAFVRVVEGHDYTVIVLSPDGLLEASVSFTAPRCYSQPWV